MASLPPTITIRSTVNVSLSLVHLPWLTMHFEDYSDVTVAAAAACKQLEVCSLERCNLSVEKSLVVKGKKKR